MKKTFIYYSILGCFATGAATASPLYINFDGACPDNTLCRVLPNAGQCCAANKTVSKINLPAGSNGWSLSIGTRTVKIFDADGYPTISSLSDTQKMIINNAIAGGATLSGAVITASEQLVTVTLDMKGGSLPVGFTQTTRTMHPGDLVLSAGVTRSDNAKFVGFYAQGASDTTASPIITVGNATTQKYIAKYTCDNDSRTYMNSKGTCVSDDGIYIDSNGTIISPSQVDATGGTNGCNWVSHGTVTLYDRYTSTSGADGWSDNNMYYYMYLNNNGVPDNTIVAATDDNTHMWSNPYTGQSTCPPQYPETGWVALANINDISNHVTSPGGYQYLKAGMPNPSSGRKLYCRSRGCWLADEGAEQPQVLYYHSTTTDCNTCSGCVDLSFVKNGVNYYYYMCPCDTNIYTGTGFSSTCSDASISISYQTTTQQVYNTETGDYDAVTVTTPVMNSGTHITQLQSQWIRTLRQPKAVGWTFRGYYRDVAGMTWFANSDTNGNAPASARFFGVGNPNNREISIIPPVSVCVTDNEGNDKIGYNINLYGAWAKNCDSYTAPGVYQEMLSCCSQTTTVNGITQCVTGQSNSYPNPHYNQSWDGHTICRLDIKNGGDTDYFTSCIDGYTLTSGGSSYNPICTAESGTVNITYVIKDQYGRIVSNNQHFVEQNLNVNWNNYNYNTCSLQPFGQSEEGSNAQYYRILDQITFERTYNNYLLKYLATNSGSNQNWYTPSQHIPCSANEFGFTYSADTNSYNTIVMGLACNMVCNINKQQEGLPDNVKRCITDNWNNYSNLSAYQADPENVFPQCYRLVNTSLCVENLLEGCPTYECNDGYKLCVPESNASLDIDPQCISSGSNCPLNMKEASSLVYPIPPVMNNNRGVQMR